MLQKLLVTLVISLFMFSSVYAQERMSRSLIASTPEKTEHPNVLNDDESSSTGKKSVLKAVVLSLLVPGMGHAYVGSFHSGKYYLMTESGLWLTYAGFRVYGNWLHQDAQTYASAKSAAKFSGKDDQFEVNIGNFNNTEEYNHEKILNNEYDLLYSGSQYQWDWQGNNANRLQFKNMRIRSASAYNNSRFVIGAVVINHVISAFMAGRAAALHNRSLAYNQSWNIEALALGENGNIHGIGLSLTKSF